MTSAFPVPPSLRVHRLSKRFGRQYALDGVSASFGAGQALALLGPNGSGKTTFLKCILGLTLPDSGKIEVMGQDIAGSWDYRRQIGYMPQIGRYPEHLRVGQLLDMIREIRGAGQPSLDEELVEAFGLRAYLHKPMRALSGGMRQKVSACLAFLFDPPVLILDEPGAGLDPLSSELLKEKLAREKSRGKLILITSHVLSELEDLISDVMYLIEGKVQVAAPLEALRAQTGEQRLSRIIARFMKPAASPSDDFLPVSEKNARL
jgi:Cu-processing system ATP-binding protein